jgi:hypothetical protein
MAFIPLVLSAGGAAVASAVALVVSVAAGVLLQALMPIARAPAAPIRSQRFAVLVILVHLPWDRPADERLSHSPVPEKVIGP